jgi:hypothetical protein
MKRLALLAASLLALAGCGPDVAGYTGTWTCSGALNTGRLPLAVAGTLTVTADGRFAARGAEQGAAGSTYTADLVAATADGTSVTFTGPTSVPLVSTPSDGCARQLTVTEGTLTRAGQGLSGVVRGTSKSDCNGSTGVSESFQLDVACTR